MTITFHCEHCRKEVQAPDSAAGHRGKCPYCKQSNYVPQPVAEDEILDLAPENEEEERLHRKQVEELRAREKALLAEKADDRAAVPVEHREDLAAADLHHFVINYCLDVFAGKIDRLRVHMAGLRKNKPVGLAAVEDFITDRTKEPALDAIPPRVLKGFLTQLRDELRKPDHARTVLR